jgi:hypothetical protein
MFHLVCCCFLQFGHGLNEETDHREVIWTSEATMKGKMVLMHTAYLVKCKYLGSLYFLFLLNFLCNLFIVLNV